MINQAKPCPFCGGRPEFNNSLSSSQIQCTECGALSVIRSFISEKFMTSSEDSANEAVIAAWNRRTDPDSDDFKWIESKIVEATKNMKTNEITLLLDSKNQLSARFRMNLHDFIDPMKHRP